jgi:hypothetical protein
MCRILRRAGRNEKERDGSFVERYDLTVLGTGIIFDIEEEQV